MVYTYNKDKVDFWKNKTKASNYLKNKFKKEVSRLLVRCADLSAKVSVLKAANKTLKAENKRLQKQVENAAQNSMDMETAAGHQYPLLLVLFCVHCQKYGTMSLRSTRNCVLQMTLIFGLNFKVPSHTSIRNWACKCGYHRAVDGAGLPDAADQKWVLWVDESITMGGQKLLLILGRPIDDWAFESAPTIANVYVMGLKLAGEWKSEAVVIEIEAVAKQHKIAYIVSDKGHNLVKSYELGGFLHIPDLTHVVAKALERIYSKAEAFISFTSKCGMLRKKWNLSQKKCAYMPPSQRGKVRFANIYPIIEWSDKALKKIASSPETIPLDVLLETKFLAENRDMIYELLALHQAIHLISKLLKNKGFSDENANEVIQILASISETENTKKFVVEMHEWLHAVEKIRQKTGYKTVFCCSDVIESTFGKFKTKININSPFGMTEFVFTIANFGADFTKEEICAALEKIKLLTLQKSRPELKSIVRQKWDIFGKEKTAKTASS
jgi:hypothetical protein